MILSINALDIVPFLAQFSKVFTFGLALIAAFVTYYSIMMIAETFDLTDTKQRENKLREKYKRDGYFGPDHPDHFSYQRDYGLFKTKPNAKKAREYYRKNPVKTRYLHTSSGTYKVTYKKVSTNKSSYRRYSKRFRRF